MRSSRNGFEQSVVPISTALASSIQRSPISYSAAHVPRTEPSFPQLCRLAMTLP